VRQFRLKIFFASKQIEAKRDPFRFVFACSSENQGPIFSLVFASFRFKFFASKQNEKNISLRFALQIFFSLHFLPGLWIRIDFNPDPAFLLNPYPDPGSGSEPKKNIKNKLFINFVKSNLK
jgi:hypothetical protein